MEPVTIAVPKKHEAHMTNPIRVLVLGTGQMGSGIARLLLRKPRLELAGMFARRAARAGRDAGPLIGLGRDIGVKVSNDLARAIRDSAAQVAIQATCSRVDAAFDEIAPLLRGGVNVISIAEEMAWPAAAAPELAARLDALALEHGVSVVGTGINPGFVLDLLPIVLSAACAEVRAVRAERINDLAPYGPTVLQSQGVGLSPARFEAGLRDGSVVGHFGFPQSIHMVAAALGWEIERIEEHREPIVSEVARSTPFVEVEPGQVAGCRHTAVAWSGGRPVITLVHPQQIQPAAEGMATGDRIHIEGTPEIHLAGSPEIPGGIATPALAVNMVPRILNAPPGLHAMTDLPPATALPGRPAND
jgi:4-hydroxy-tetrahydrodipicolinate reductase